MVFRGDHNSLNLTTPKQDFEVSGPKYHSIASVHEAVLSTARAMLIIKEWPSHSKYLKNCQLSNEQKLLMSSLQLMNVVKPSGQPSFLDSSISCPYVVICAMFNLEV